MTRYTKRGGQVWIKIFPDKPVTEKPAETRMGSGKGSPEYWVASSSPAVSCSRSPVFPKRSPARPCVWPATSCPSRRRSSSARTQEVGEEMKATEVRAMTVAQLNRSWTPEEGSVLPAYAARNQSAGQSSSRSPRPSATSPASRPLSVKAAPRRKEVTWND